jgi:hypothetical protein
MQAGGMLAGGRAGAAPRLRPGLAIAIWTGSMRCGGSAAVRSPAGARGPLAVPSGTGARGPLAVPSGTGARGSLTEADACRACGSLPGLPPAASAAPATAHGGGLPDGQGGLGRREGGIGLEPLDHLARDGGP